MTTKAASLSMEPTGRLLTLDAMRGVAAIFVVLFHLSAFNIAGGGYLAVDLFFVLSGLVISRTYDARLSGGLKPTHFVILRVVRLYPLFLVGLVLALAKACGQLIFEPGESLSAPQIVVSMATELFMLPSPATGGELFPLNGPSWSLFFELVINIAYAITALIIRPRWLILFALVSAGLMIQSALHAQILNVGWDWPTFGGGIGRVGFSFTVGVLIQRLGFVRAAQRVTWWALVPLLVVLPALVPNWDPVYRAYYDLPVALILLPLMVVLGANLYLPAGLQRVGHFLGEISYALYAIHFPLIFITHFIATKAHVPDLIWKPALVVGLMVLASLLEKFYDRPVRRVLTAWLKRAVFQKPAIASVAEPPST